MSFLGSGIWWSLFIVANLFAFVFVLCASGRGAKSKRISYYVLWAVYVIIILIFIQNGIVAGLVAFFSTMTLGLWTNRFVFRAFKRILCKFGPANYKRLQQGQEIGYEEARFRNQMEDWGHGGPEVERDLGLDVDAVEKFGSLAKYLSRDPTMGTVFRESGLSDAAIEQYLVELCYVSACAKYAIRDPEVIKKYLTWRAKSSQAVALGRVDKMYGL